MNVKFTEESIVPAHLLKISGIIPLIVLLGCSNPADDVPQASVKPVDPADNTASPAGQVSDKKYALTADSTIGFVGSKVTGSHQGGFKKFAGQFTVVDGKLADAGQMIVIDINSLWSDNDRLTGHLKSPDFFDVAQHPTATFTSTSIQSSDAGHQVTGNLSLHGVTKNISFPAKIQITDEQITVQSDFSINRFDFDINYPGKVNDLIRQEVVLKLDVKATPGQADFASLANP